MRRILSLVCILLLLPTLTWGAMIIQSGDSGGVAETSNDFSSDANAVAVWNFDDGELTTDSKGDNVLTTQNTPTADTTDFQQGNASVDIEESDNDYFLKSDTSLDAGFPYKNGESQHTISICFWMKAESFAHNGFLIGKWDSGVGKRQFAVVLMSTGSLEFRLADSSQTTEAFAYNSTVSTGTWYHVGISYDNSTSESKMRIYDKSTSSVLGSVNTHTFSITPFDTDSAISIGTITTGSSVNNYDGLIDEKVITNDVLTTSEMGEIQEGTYQ